MFYDPWIAKYAVCILNRNIQTDYEKDFEVTAVGQVIAFTIWALASLLPSQVWHDAVRGLDV